MLRAASSASKRWGRRGSLTLLALSLAGLALCLASFSPGPATVQAADSRPVLTTPRAVPGVGWRLEWTSTPGLQYRLDSAPRLDASTLWTPLTTLSATGSVVRYDDPAGAAQRYYRVTVESGAPSEPRMVGSTPLTGTFASTNAGTWIATTPMKAGLIDLPASAGSPIVVDPVRQRLTGTGTVHVPGLGTVVQGALVIDLAAGQLTGPATPALQPAPGVSLAFRTVRIDVNTGAVSGEGTAQLAVDLTAPGGARTQALATALATPAPDPVITLDGTLTWDPVTTRLSFTGRAVYRDVTLQGRGTIDVAHATCDLRGTLSVPGTTATPYTFDDAQFALVRPLDAEPSILLGGRPTLAALSALAVRLDGTYSGASTPGEEPGVPYTGNRSVRFGGAGSVVLGTQPEFAGLASAMTVEAWVRVAAFDRPWNTIVSRGDNSWRLQRDNTGRALRFDTDGLNPPYLAGSRALDDGRWHHMVATYDGRVKALYIDGELDAWTPATGTIASSTHAVVIGENAQATGRFWNGWIDEVALYRRALSPDEVLAHARAGGAWETRARLHLAVSGLSQAALAGTFAGSGSFDLSTEGTTTLAPGGYALQSAGLRALRLGTAAPSLLLNGRLELPGIVAVALEGGYSSAAGFALDGQIASGSLAGIEVANLALHLRTASGQTTLNASAQLPVPVLGSLPLQGSVGSDGTFALANTSLPGNRLFGYAVSSWNAALRRSPSMYSALVAGDPLVLADQGAAPLAYWRLGEITGTSAGDAKKATFGRPDYLATYTGGARLGDASGLTGPLNVDRSVFLDGLDDVIVVANEPAFDLSRAVSVEAWIRVASWTKAWQAVVTKGDSAWRLSRYGSTGRISFETTSGGTHHSLGGGPDLHDNRWHHVVATYDGQAKALYIDGALEAYALYDRELDRNDWPVQLGGNAQVAGRTFHGGLDEVAIYDRALSPDEVVRHYVAGGGPGVNLATRLTIPGLQGIDTLGLLHPRGAASVQASFTTLTAGGFTLRDGRLAFARTPAGTSLAALRGSLSTDFGTLALAGSVESSGAFTLTTAPTGSLTLGGYPFSYSVPIELTPNLWETQGSLAYGGFALKGTLKVPVPGLPSFTGTASGTTSPKAFGKTTTGNPGHPYAWVAWNTSGTYDPGTRALNASVGGTLTVEYESPPGNYVKKNFPFGPVTLGTSGALSLKPGETFSGISTFNFTLP